MKKKTILIKAFGDSNWIGGLYYFKNITFVIASNSKVREEYSLILITYPEYKAFFADLPSCIRFIYLKHKKGFLRRIELALYELKYRFNFIYPSTKGIKVFGSVGISWISDFQHKHYPEFFSQAEIKLRNENYERIVKSSGPLILSSNDALKDFHLFCDATKSKNAFVVPFVSYICNDISNIRSDYEDSVLKKYGLYEKNYFCVMNQFWRHKNHIVVLKAMIKLLNKTPSFGSFLVLTGKPNDYRDQEYVNQILKYLDNPTIRQHVIMLGFIDRREQIVLMKRASFIIQPSLFEGWGTVVEDAKVLNKTVLLSDIPVHREQMNDKCILFDPYDDTNLSSLIEEECSKKHFDDVNKGLEDMEFRAIEYSKGFEKMLGSIK